MEVFIEILAVPLKVLLMLLFVVGTLGAIPIAIVGLTLLMIGYNGK